MKNLHKNIKIVKDHIEVLESQIQQANNDASSRKKFSNVKHDFETLLAYLEGEQRREQIHLS